MFLDQILMTLKTLNREIIEWPNVGNIFSCTLSGEKKVHVFSALSNDPKT